MAYTINANAKNVWIRDNENTRDLSIQTDASSVYLDNGRTLEQELGEGSMVSSVATVDSAMSKVIDGTLDGAYESLVFKGKSLVNLVRLNSKITSNSPIDINILPIDHTKTYLLKVRINEAPTFTNESDSQMALKVQYFSSKNPKGFTAISNSNMVKGYELTKIVTPTLESDTNGKFTLWIPRYISGTLNVDVVFIPYQESMEDWGIPYFEGLCDVKMPILRNVGKNLFDGTVSTTNRRISTSSGGSYASDGYSISQYIQIKPNTTYAVKTQETTYFAFYDKNKQYTNGGGATYKFTTGINSCYVRFDFKSDEIETVQLEESPTPTTYENYKTNILHTSEEIVLREVGGVCDTYNVLTGEYVQRIGETIFDGSDDEGWRFQSINGYGIANFLANAPFKDIPKILCNSLVEQTTLIAETTTEGIYMQNNQSVYVRILSSKASTVALFKAYLQSNPITVQYELAEPVITIIEPSTVPFAYENGHIILESGHEGQSLLPTLEYSTVVNRTGQVESVAKTIQTQEKQLTMLEQMLIQNIIGLDYNNTVLALNLEINEVM